jgi:hypothetical protein
MQNPYRILIVVALTASGCANCGSFQALDGSEQPLSREPSTAFAQIGAVLGLGVLYQAIDPDSQLDSDTPRYEAGYSPLATRKEVRGH